MLDGLTSSQTRTEWSLEILVGRYLRRGEKKRIYNAALALHSLLDHRWPFNIAIGIDGSVTGYIVHHFALGIPE